MEADDPLWQPLMGAAKRRFHQKQLLEETQGDCPSPSRPTQLDVERHNPSHTVPHGGAREVNKIPVPGPAAAPSILEAEPVVRFNTWVNSDSPHQSLPLVCGPRLSEEPIHLEDVQTDEDKLNSSMLSSESTFIPFTSDLEPKTIHSDSEDETETFEPDSLAPKQPAQPKKHNPNKPHCSPPAEQHQSKMLEREEGISAAATTTSGSLGVRVSTPKNDLETDFGKAEGNEALKQEEVNSKSGLMEIDRAAIKIQSWWRGHYIRCCHPMAREVRSEIRLRRMQEHILFLSDKLDHVQKQYEEERLQRLVQEEAVKFLWKEFQAMQQWKQSVEQQLAAITQAATPAHISSSGLCKAAPPFASSTTNPPSTDVSFPDSGFQSTSNQQVVQEDSFLSSGTADSLKTVRALSPVRSGFANGSDQVDSADCSLLEQYLSSVQQREEEAEEAISDRTKTPQPSSPVSPAKTATPTNSPTEKAAETAPGSV